MSKRDYEAIAIELNDEYQRGNNTEQKLILRLAERFADYFEDNNRHFDRDRFVAAVVDGV